MNTLKNKVALITGASSGIGQATALIFAKEGAKVVVVDIKEADHTMNMIKSVGAEAIFIKCNVSKGEEVKNMIEKIISTYGKLDIAFNNAGIEGITTTIQECTEENWDNTIAVNLKSIFLCMKYEISEMMKQGKGAIVNCASIAGLVGFQGAGAYTASKHGIIGLTKTAALECAHHNIRINAVCPGIIKTPMIERATQHNKEAEERYAQAEPIGRLGTAQEVANAVIWLCSEESSFVTGHPMVIDGGWVAQ